MYTEKVLTFPLNGHNYPYSSFYSSGTTLSSPPTSGGSTSSDKCQRTRVHSLKPFKNRHQRSKHFIDSLLIGEMRQTNVNHANETHANHGSNHSPIEPFFVARRSIESNSSNNSSNVSNNSDSTVVSTSQIINRRSNNNNNNNNNNHDNQPLSQMSMNLTFMPNAKRSCTDCSFLLILLIALSVSGISLFNVIFVDQVNANLVLNGHDDWGNVCGQPNDPIEGALWSGQNMTNRKYMLLRLGRNQSVNSICIENCSFNDYFKTAFNRCLPKPLLLKPMFHMFNVTKGVLEQILMDSLLCADEIINLCIWSIMMSFVLLILLRFFVVFIVWLTIFVLGALLIFFTFYFWASWSLEENHVDNLPSSVRTNRSFEHFNELSPDSWLALAIISSILTFLFFVIIFWARKNIKFVTLLFKEAGKATSSMPFLLIYPFLTLVMLSVTFSYLIVSIIFMEANVHPKLIPNTTMVKFEQDETAQFIKWYNIILFLWITHFIYACQHYVIASSVARWYFSKKHINCCPVLCSIYQLIRYHLGSLAFGSLLITGIKVFKIFLKKLQSIFQKYEQSNSICSKMMQFVVWLIERLVIYINKNAYILTAIYGTNFRQSAKEAFQFIMSNSLRLTLINSLCDFLLLVGKLVIVAITILIGFEQTRIKHEKLNFVWGPLVLPVIFSYLVAHCFLTVYEMAIDTLFICFCETSGPEELENQWASNSHSNHKSQLNARY